MRKVLVYNGGAVALEPFPGGVGSGTNYLHQATALYDEAQVRALPTTPIVIIAAPGANKITCPIFVVWHLNWVSDFGNISADARLRVQCGGVDVVAYLENTTGQVSLLLAQSGPGGVNSFAAPNHELGTGIALGYSGLPDADVVDQPIRVLAANVDGDFTLGTGSSLRVSILYHVFDIVTGLFDAA